METKLPSTEEQPRGAELLRRAVNQIIEHPETWKQSSWHCGSTHCIAGWCQILAGRQQTSSPSDEVQKLLGISDSEASWLFDGNRKLHQMYMFAEAMLDRDGYNRAGYDSDGYDSDGYDRDGYNRDGYNRDGKRLPLLQAVMPDATVV